MGISYEPSITEQLGPQNIENFGKAIGNILKPNFAFQQAMHTAIAANPKLAQELRDLEAEAPGSLRNLGFGAVGDVINMMPESTESQFRRTKRGDIIKGKEQELELQNLQSGVSIQNVRSLIDYLKTNAGKAIMPDVALRMLGLDTRDQQRLTKARADVEEAKVPLELTEAARKKQDYEDIVKRRPGLQKLDLMKTAKDFIAGKLQDQSAAYGLLHDPETHDAFEAALTSARAQAHEAFLESEQDKRLGAERDRMIAADAYKDYVASGRTGTLKAWKLLYNDPEKAEEIRNKTGTLSREEMDVQHALEGQEQLQASQEFITFRPVMAAIHTAISDLGAAERRDAPMPERQAIVGNLNKALERKSARTGKTVIARYGRRPDVGSDEPHAAFSPFNKGDGLFYIDDKGIRLPDSAATDEPDLTISAGAARAIHEIMKTAPELRGQALQNLKAANLDLYNKVINSIGLKDTSSAKSPPKLESPSKAKAAAKAALEAFKDFVDKATDPGKLDTTSVKPETTVRRDTTKTRSEIYEELRKKYPRETNAQILERMSKMPNP